MFCLGFPLFFDKSILARYMVAFNQFWQEMAQTVGAKVKIQVDKMFYEIKSGRYYSKKN